MKRRHLPPALLLLLLSLLSLSFRRRLLATTTQSAAPSHDDAGERLIRRLAEADGGSQQILAEADALFANASISTFPSLGNRYRLLYLRLPYLARGGGSSPPRKARTVVRLRVPAEALPSDEALVASFRASVGSFLLGYRRRRDDDVAGVMGDVVGLLGRRYRTCAVVGNSGVLLGSGRGAQIDAHDLVIRLNNARVAGFAADVGGKTSLSFVNSNILHLCAARSAAVAAGCGCHPYGPTVPMAMYICQPAHLLDALVCNATATAASSSPFPLLVSDARLDALCARIAKYYSLRRFVSTTGEPATNWTRKHDDRFFHYSSGMQAVVVALGACDEVSLFGFGKAPGAKHHYHTNQKKELALHDYEAEYDFYADLQSRPETVPFLGRFTAPPVRLHR